MPCSLLVAHRSSAKCLLVTDSIDSSGSYCHGPEKAKGIINTELPELLSVTRCYKCLLTPRRESQSCKECSDPESSAVHRCLVAEKREEQHGEEDADHETLGRRVGVPLW